MLYLYNVISFFAILLLYSFIKKKWAISTYIISIYLFTLVVALFIWEFFPLYSDSVKGATIFTSAISLFIFPYIRKEPQIIGLSNRYSRQRILKICERISTLLVILEVCITPIVIERAQTGFTNLREGEGVVQLNFVASFFVNMIDIVSPLSYSLLTIFFYLYVFVSCKKRLLVMVLLASFSAPYYGIMSGGRTQMIYWLLSLLFNFILFYKYMDEKKKKKLIKIFVIIVGIILLYISIATIARFSSSDWGTENSLLIYMGQSYLQFNNFIDNFPQTHHFTLRRIFPFTYSLLFGVEAPGVYYNEILSRTGMDIGVFYTLLGDLYIDVGIGGMYIYAITYFLLTSFVLRKKTLDLSSLLIMSLLFLIPLQGVFYYSFWKRQVTFCALLVLWFSRYIKVLRV